MPASPHSQTPETPAPSAPECPRGIGRRTVLRAGVAGIGIGGAALVVGSGASAGGTPAYRFHIDPRARHQRIEGFGASGAWWARTSAPGRSATQRGGSAAVLAQSGHRPVPVPLQHRRRTRRDDPGPVANHGDLRDRARTLRLGSRRRCPVVPAGRCRARRRGLRRLRQQPAAPTDGQRPHLRHPWRGVEPAAGELRAVHALSPGHRAPLPRRRGDRLPLHQPDQRAPVGVGRSEPGGLPLRARRGARAHPHGHRRLRRERLEHGRLGAGVRRVQGRLLRAGLRRHTPG